VVKHLLACTNASWEGLPGPNTARTLEGVNYLYRVPSDAEFPELDLWLYARFYLTNGIDGVRDFSVEVHWLDAPGEALWVVTRHLGNVRFRAASPVTNVAWSVPNLRFPGRGRFEFRLICEFRTWRGNIDRSVGSETIRIE
jgi:hypothetical protein